LILDDRREGALLGLSKDAEQGTAQVGENRESSSFGQSSQALMSSGGRSREYATEGSTPLIACAGDT